MRPQRGLGPIWVSTRIAVPKNRFEGASSAHPVGSGQYLIIEVERGTTSPSCCIGIFHG